MSNEHNRSDGDCTVDWRRFDAVLFDLDGVLTPTAEVHEAAWKQMFDEFLHAVHPEQPDFSNDDYLTFVDGKPRLDGVRSFVESRGIDLPIGEDDDGPGHGSIVALGHRKNELFTDILRRDGITPYPGSLVVLELLADLGVPSAVVSSSRNAPEVLRAAGLDARFPLVVDGNVAADLGLRGKPAPDMFLEAARQLGVKPSAAAVVEDAMSGALAARSGGFGFILGVDRGRNRAALLANGASDVVDDLAETLPANESERQT